VADAQTVRLEYLRFGPDQPVFLRNLVPASEHVWQADVPHLCLADTYGLRLTVEPAGLLAQGPSAAPRSRNS
jgi:hypothetical protein